MDLVCPAGPTSPVTICIDIDDVCGKMVPTWFMLYNWVWDDSVNPAEVNDWELSRFIKPEARESFYGLLAFPGFYQLVKPYEGFAEGVAALRSKGYVVRYASACVPGSVDGKLAWLQHHDPDFSWKDAHMGYHKNELVGDVLIDDGPHNLLDWPGKTIRFHQKWNVGIPANAHVRSWAEIPAAVERALQTADRYVAEV